MSCSLSWKNNDSLPSTVSIHHSFALIPLPGTSSSKISHSVWMDSHLSQAPVFWYFNQSQCFLYLYHSRSHRPKDLKSRHMLCNLSKNVYKSKKIMKIFVPQFTQTYSVFQAHQLWDWNQYFLTYPSCLSQVCSRGRVCQIHKTPHNILLLVATSVCPFWCWKPVSLKIVIK